MAINQIGELRTYLETLYCESNRIRIAWKSVVRLYSSK
jgi:hypothetical protein